jgi:hypothetical protein
MNTSTTDADTIQAYMLALSGVPASQWPALLLKTLQIK